MKKQPTKRKRPKKPVAHIKTRPPTTIVKVIDSYSENETELAMLPTLKIDIQLPEGSNPDPAWMREQARFLYTSSLHRVTLEQISKMPAFVGRCSLKSLQNWSLRDGWVELRRRNADAWRRHMAFELGRQIVESRRVLLRDLRTLANHMYEELLPNSKGKFKYPINSYEGLGQVFIKVVKAIDSLSAHESHSRARRRPRPFESWPLTLWQSLTACKIDRLSPRQRGAFSKLRSQAESQSLSPDGRPLPVRA